MKCKLHETASGKLDAMDTFSLQLQIFLIRAHQQTWTLLVSTMFFILIKYKIWDYYHWIHTFLMQGVQHDVSVHCGNSCTKQPPEHTRDVASRKRIVSWVLIILKHTPLICLNHTMTRINGFWKEAELSNRALAGGILQEASNTLVHQAYCKVIVKSS